MEKVGYNLQRDHETIKREKNIIKTLKERTAVNHSIADIYFQALMIFEKQLKKENE